jgi:hypothetical protein
VKSGVAVLAFAPHSGWSAVVALGGSSADPRLLARSRVEMADPAAPESRQPYHTVEALPLEQAARRLAGYRAVAEEMAYAAIQALRHDLVARGHAAASVGILDSSGRTGASLAAVLASHALIHTADGDHFRQALATAAARCGLLVSRVRGRDLQERAQARLGRSASQLQQRVKELGRQAGPPWGADQKAAALLAWTLLDQEELPPTNALKRTKRGA